jgi:hypothetical protein
VLYAAVPILLPTFICFGLLKLTVDSRASKARIKLLEDAISSESGKEKLITFLRNLEKEMESTVTELADSPESTSIQTEQPNSMVSSTETLAIEPMELETNSKESKKLKSKKKSKSGMSKEITGQPTLKPSQQHMVQSLNTNLTQLKKYAAFIHPSRNSHGAIVSRDVAHFDFHQIGEGVLRHWADGFVF